MKPSTAFSKKINNYHSARWRYIHQYLKDYMQAQDNNTLHKLRVEIKKLFALAHFIEFNNVAFNSEKSMQPLIKIFKLLGKQRDYNNSLKFCNKFNIKKSVVKKPFSTSKEFIKKLKSSCKKYDVDLDELKIQIKEALNYRNSVVLKKYISICNKDIKAAIKDSMIKSGLHSARKKIKDMFYLAKLADSNSVQFISSLKLKRQDVMQDLIGKWHDLDKFHTMLENRKNIKIGQKKFQTIKNEEQKLLREIRSLASSYR